MDPRSDPWNVIGALGTSSHYVWVAFLLRFYDSHFWAPIGCLCLLLTLVIAIRVYTFLLNNGFIMLR